MSARPPLPPRRQPPPPPPHTRGLPTEDEPIPRGIAARIASLQLEQTGREKPSPANPPPIPVRRKVTSESIAREAVSRPPPIPPKWTRPKPEDLVRALARRPPPPPRKPSVDLSRSPSLPDVPQPVQRRLPPMPPPSSVPITHFEPDHLAPGPEAYSDDTGSCAECRDFSHVDAHAALFPRHTVISLDNLAYDLTEPFPYEVEKARSIFTWLHHNITYDAEAFFSGNIQAATPESTLSSGLAVCDGYAGLFKSLAERVGIQVHKVTGHGKGVGFEPPAPDHPVPHFSSNHAWNCAYVDGEWRLIDSCWGAGALNGALYQQRFAPMWFTSSSREFGRTHFPEDPSYQLISEDDGGPLLWEDYITEPAGPVIFVDFYKLNLWPTALLPTTRTVQGGTRVVFYVFKRCEHMSTADSDNFVYMISVGNERVPLEVNSEGGWGADVYIPRGPGEVLLHCVTTVNGQDAKGIGIRAVKNALGRAAMSFGGLAKWIVI